MRGVFELVEVLSVVNPSLLLRNSSLLQMTFLLLIHLFFHLIPKASLVPWLVFSLLCSVAKWAWLEVVLMVVQIQSLVLVAKFLH